MPGIDFDDLRKRISILDVLALLGTPPVRGAGYRLRGPCPFACGASDRDFAAYLDTNRYQCFSCGRLGNAIELWAAVRHLTFYAAACDLCRRLGIDPPSMHRW